MTDALNSRFSDIVVDFGVTANAMDRLGKEDKRVNFPGTMNLRDALAHIHSAITLAIDTPNSEREQLGQIACAREHIRRAAVEPIQALFTERYKAVAQQYDHYKSNYIGEEAHQHVQIDHKYIRKQFRDLLNRLKLFRHGKSDLGWKHKIDDLFDAYKELECLSAHITQCQEKTHAAIDSNEDW